MPEIKNIQLKGRVFITFDVEAVTGLHIGGSDTGIEIGGVDKTVIRDPITNRPYIPGSSLKGKVRSLLEKYRGLAQNQRIGQGFIHSCDDKEEYPGCDICQIFGVPGERDFATPTRLVVRDVHLSDASAKTLEELAHTDLPYTEVKTEVSIDRVTSAANPRQMERVPAGSIFGGTRKVKRNGQDQEIPQPAEMVYSVYKGDDCDPHRDVARLRTVIEGLQLLEDDYLGGLGSRGSGKVRIENIRVAVRGNGDYLAEPRPVGKYADLSEMASELDDLTEGVKNALGLS
jgi:CRISPR-associated protein Csm3